MIAARPDLLVIGGLTIDRFPDGSSAGGGSVLHIARAAAPRGVRVRIITVAGPEPEAGAALEELRGLSVSVEGADGTATFIHRDSPAGRRLWLERGGGSIRVPELDPHELPRAILVAPIAGEVSTVDLASLDAASTRGAILQGFVRSFAPDGEVQPRQLSTLAPELAAALSRFDLVVASREDLLGEAADPPNQLGALRLHLGPRPVLVVTDGVRGAWLEREHLPVPWRVDGVPSIGAGDVFAAFMLAEPWPRERSHSFVRERAQAAMRVVAEVLEERRGQARRSGNPLRPRRAALGGRHPATQPTEARLDAQPDPSQLEDAAAASERKGEVEDT
jgi:sugar/nucleoside kinase (ribokinase family)